MTATLTERPSSMPDEAARGTGRHPLVYALFALIILVGVGSRVRTYRVADGLVHDDTGLAAIVIRSDEARLLKPLPLNQSAPVGYLLLLKESTRLWGSGEWALRLPSLAASIAALALFLPLIARVTPPAGQAIGLTLAATAWPLIYYAMTIKQYSVDVLASVAILLAGFRALSSPRGPGRFAPLGLVGLVAVFFSQPSVFMLAGVGSVLIVAALVDRDYRGALTWTATAAAWVAAFGGLYLAIYRAYHDNDYLSSFWGTGFAPFPPRSVDQIKWYIDTYFSMFGTSVGLKFTGLAGAVALIGAWDLARRGLAREVAMLVAPVAVALAASALKKYPFADRLILFLFPSLAVLVAAGASALIALTWAGARPVAIVLPAVLLLTPVHQAVKVLRSGMPAPHDIKPALAYVSEHHREGDAVFLDCQAVHMAHYYRDLLNYKDTRRFPVVEGIYAGDAASLSDRLDFYGRQLAPLRGRAWIVFAMERDTQEPLYRCLLGRRGKLLDAFEGRSSSALLYDLGPADATAAAAATPGGPSPDPRPARP